MTALVIGGPGDGMRVTSDILSPHYRVMYPSPDTLNCIAPNIAGQYRERRVADYKLIRIGIAIGPEQSQENYFYVLPGMTNGDIMTALFNNYTRRR